MGSRKGTSWATAALLLSAVAAGPALAGPGTLTTTGVVDGSVALLAGTTPFSNAAFTATVNFNSSPDFGSPGFHVWFPTSINFDIGGIGTFTSQPPGPPLVNVFPPQVPALGTYGVELPSLTGSLNEFFNTAHTFMVAPGDVETVYSDATTFQQPGAPGFTETLAGGGTLLITNFDSLADTATLVVPEPAGLALLAGGVAASLPLRRRHRG